MKTRPSDFTKYDAYAVEQINRNIQLIRYRRYGDDLLLFELVNSKEADPLPPETPVPSPDSIKGKASKAVGTNKTFTEYLSQASEELRDRYEAVRAFAEALGDDVETKQLKYYTAFRRLKNFACVDIRPRGNELLVFLKVDPKSLALESGFSRDVSNIGHFGTGDLELTLRSAADLERAKPLIVASYQAS